jgi:hypothetical protein
VQQFKFEEDVKGAEPVGFLTLLGVIFDHKASLCFSEINDARLRDNNEIIVIPCGECS